MRCTQLTNLTHPDAPPPLQKNPPNPPYKKGGKGMLTQRRLEQRLFERVEGELGVIVY